MNLTALLVDIEKLSFARVCEMFHNEPAAITFIEAVRWPDGPVCPRCNGKSVRPVCATSRQRPLLYCRECEKQFSVTVGTIMEDTKIPLHKWVWAIHLVCASKKGVSALQVQRMLGLAYRSAWHLCHRIRHAMGEAQVAKLTGTVEADETYVGGTVHGKGRGYRGNKAAVVAIVERGGRVRSVHMSEVTGRTIGQHLRAHVEVSAALMTDESALYTLQGKAFASHETVNHSAKEYVRGCCHTNTAEGFFANLKRGIIGTFHHVSQKHLGRYLSEFDYKYNTRFGCDGARMVQALRMGDGKRLYLFRSKTQPDAPCTQDWAL